MLAPSALKLPDCQLAFLVGHELVHLAQRHFDEDAHSLLVLSAKPANWTLAGAGFGIHWPDLDEDISVEGLLEGVPSQESPGSLREWLRRRNARPPR